MKSKEKQYVGYLILAHENNKKLHLLIETLLLDPRSVIFIHMDAKTKNYIEDSQYDSRVNFIHNRISVNWGGFSVVEATISLLKIALKNIFIQRFVLISGGCFPIQSPSAINNKLLKSEENMVSIWGKIDPSLKSAEGLGRFVVSKFHPYDIKILNPKNSIFHARAWNIYKKLIKNITIERKVSLSNLWKGSQFFAVTRSVAEQFAAPHPELKRIFQNTLAPDETYFSTIFVRYAQEKNIHFDLHSPASTDQVTHYIIKRVPSSRSIRQKLFQPVDLRKLTEKDISTAINSDCLFARKCSEDLSKKIMKEWQK